VGCDAIYRDVQFDWDTLKMAVTGSLCLYTDRNTFMFRKSRTFCSTAVRMSNLSPRNCLLSVSNSVSLYALRIIAMKLPISVKAQLHVKRYFAYIVLLLLAMQFR
jgi:hypothetical protein